MLLLKLAVICLEVSLLLGVLIGPVLAGLNVCDSIATPDSSHHYDEQDDQNGDDLAD
jgi:hypothetical protein